MSVTGWITLNNTKAGSEGTAQGNLVLDDGADTFNLIRAVAKVRLICRVKDELPSNNFQLETFEILQANRRTFLFPKYAVENDKWTIDFPSMTEAADLRRTVGYVYGKQEIIRGRSGWSLTAERIICMKTILVQRCRAIHGRD